MNVTDYSTVPEDGIFMLFRSSAFTKKKSCSEYFCTYGILLKRKFSILEAEIPRTRIAESKVICILHLDRYYKIASHPGFHLKKSLHSWSQVGQYPFLFSRMMAPFLTTPLWGDTYCVVSVFCEHTFLWLGQQESVYLSCSIALKLYIALKILKTEHLFLRVCALEDFIYFLFPLTCSIS